VIQSLYTIFDAVAEEAGPVFCAVNHGVARRNFMALLREVPEVDKMSYKLHFVGTFDTEDMSIIADAPLEIDWRQELPQEEKS